MCVCEQLYLYLWGHNVYIYILINAVLYIKKQLIYKHGGRARSVSALRSSALYQHSRLLYAETLLKTL